MNAAEHRAEAERILRFIKDRVDPKTRAFRGSRADLEVNVARAHVHALLALSAPDAVEEARARYQLSCEQAREWMRARSAEQVAELKNMFEK